MTRFRSYTQAKLLSYEKHPSLTVTLVLTENLGVWFYHLQKKKMDPRKSFPLLPFYTLKQESYQPTCKNHTPSP